MITRNDTPRDDYCEFMGLSTDTKPEKPGENSLFYELDTGEFYYFSGVWAKIGEKPVEKAALIKATVTTTDPAFAGYGTAVLPAIIFPDVGETVTLIFDGTEYTCEVQEFDAYPAIGSLDFDFADYPFVIYNEDGYLISTPDEAEHTVEMPVEIKRVPITATLNPSPGSNFGLYLLALENGVLSISFDEPTLFLESSGELSGTADAIAVGIPLCVYGNLVGVGFCGACGGADILNTDIEGGEIGDNNGEIIYDGTSPEITILATGGGSQ